MALAIPERYPRAGPASAAALTRLLAIRGALGITRIADITGLDRTGLPAIQVCRPLSLSNAVSQGKGADLATAAISALLESAESFFAERVDAFATEIASAGALGVPRDRFARHLRADAPSRWFEEECAWVRARDLLTGRAEPVPLELVHTAYVHPPLRHDGCFLSSTTGLAAAFDAVDATLHGVLECAERDAIAVANARHGFLHDARIDPATIDHPGLNALIDALRARGLLVGIWLAPSRTGIPVAWCQLMESGDGGPPILPYAADGSAASGNLAAAIGHAICEAAQTRLAAISGARDDITAAAFPRYPDWDRIRAHRRLLAEGPRPLDFVALCDRPTPAGDLDWVLSGLERAGVSSVLAVAIDTAPVESLSVVKTVIPDLQPLLEG
jgi:ribosomal protein S12 methylthiotransferase accessory factor